MSMTGQRSREFRVAEIFGPTIQGEGRTVGMPCHFVRFGGCDFRCSWCDTPHAVLPERVEQLPKMDEWAILTQLLELDQPQNDAFIRWVVLTGGNPGLLNLEYLVELLHVRSYKVMVETQGSTYRPWYTHVDDLCFSPKPPSSGMEWDFVFFDKMLVRLMKDSVKRARELEQETFPLPYLKVPVFDVGDLNFALKVHQSWPDLEMFVSIGNDNPMLPTVGNPNPVWPKSLSEIPPETSEEAAAVVMQNFRDVLEQILHNWPGLQDCRIFPQQHVLLWGNARGH